MAHIRKAYHVAPHLSYLTNSAITLLIFIHYSNTLLEAPTIFEGLQIHSTCSAALDLLSMLASASNLTSEEQRLLDSFMPKADPTGT